MSISKKKRSKLRGFTVLEMMVSLGIMVTIITTVMYNYPSASLRANLGILNSEVALTIREAQLRGSGVDSQNMTTGGYGVFFDRASTTEYVFFADNADHLGSSGIMIGDGFYTSGVVNEARMITKTPAKFIITKICVGKGYPFTAANSGSCNDDATAGYPAISTLTISFIRPKPRPNITVNQLLMSERGGLPGACIEMSIIASGVGGFGSVRSTQVYTSGRTITQSNGCQ